MAANNFILAGDIGGTKTHLALFSLRGEKLQFELKKTFPSKQYQGLESFSRVKKFHSAGLASGLPVRWSTVKSKPPTFHG